MSSRRGTPPESLKQFDVTTARRRIARLCCGETAATVGIVLLVALVVAPAVRSVAIEINHAAGTVWPFSWDHCHTPSSPGCEPVEPAHRPPASGTR